MVTKKDLASVKVALIFPSYKNYHDPVAVKENKEHLGAIPPLSLAYVAAILESIGVTVRIIDASALHLTMEEVSALLVDFKPDFLGFNATTIDFHCTLRWCRYLKDSLRIPIILGGIHLSVYPQETMTHICIDYGVIGDAEETLPELLDAIVNDKPLANVKGILYRDHERIITTEKRTPVSDLEPFPVPARHLLPNDKYYSFISKQKPFTAMLTSRGCAFNCIFCDSQTVEYRCYSADRVVDEIEECVKKYRVKEIDIFDALFSVDRKRVFEICDGILKRDLKVKWSFRTRVDLVDKEMLQCLKKAGCIRICYGIESGDEEVLKNINKGTTVDRIKKTIALTKENGIQTLGYFMFGNIGETHESIKKTLGLMLGLEFDFVQISATFPPPNTILYAKYKEEFGYDYWREYTLDASKSAALPYVGTSLSEKEIKDYIYKCYLKFYLRPNYILKFIAHLSSFHEFWRSLKALAAVIGSYAERKRLKHNNTLDG